MNKFYEFHNDIIIRLDKIVAVGPVYVKQGVFKLGNNVEVSGHRDGKINAFCIWFDSQSKNSIEIFNLINDTYIPVDEFKNNQYSNFIKTWKEYINDIKS